MDSVTRLVPQPSLFDGKPCHTCKIWKPLSEFPLNYRANLGGNRASHEGNCKECLRAKSKRWQTANPEKKAAMHRRWKQNNIEHYRAYRREYHAEHPEIKRAHRKTDYARHAERYKARAKEWAQENPERCLAAQHRFHERNPDAAKGYMEKAIAKDPDAHYQKVRVKAKEYRQENPQKVRIAQGNCRAQRKKATGRFTNEEWSALCDKYGHQCLCCGCVCKPSIDHIIPLARGGSNLIDNLQPICVRCNKWKHTRIIDFRSDKSSLVAWTPKPMWPHKK